MNHVRRKIAIYGGAFSPPQVGHAMAFEALIRLFPCDEIWVMPSKDRGDKKVSASGEDRLSMLHIMQKELFNSSPVPVVISSFEIDLPGFTRTIETKEALEREYPDYEFYFAVGSEILQDIRTKWVRGEELWHSTRFIVLARMNDIPEMLPDNFTVLGEGSRGVDISSTFVRGLIASGASGIPYVTPGVARYIQEKGLYKTS